MSFLRKRLLSIGILLSVTVLIGLFQNADTPETAIVMPPVVVIAGKDVPPTSTNWGSGLGTSQEGLGDYLIYKGTAAVPATAGQSGFGRFFGYSYQLPNWNRQVASTYKMTKAPDTFSKGDGRIALAADLENRIRATGNSIYLAQSIRADLRASEIKLRNANTAGNQTRKEVQAVGLGAVQLGHDSLAKSDQKEAAFYANLAREAASIVVGGLPVIGDAKGIIDALVGRDVFTGRKMDMTERIFNLSLAGKSLLTGGLDRPILAIGKLISLTARNVSRTELRKVADWALGTKKAEPVADQAEAKTLVTAAQARTPAQASQVANAADSAILEKKPTVRSVQVEEVSKAFPNLRENIDKIVAEIDSAKVADTNSDRAGYPDRIYRGQPVTKLEQVDMNLFALEPFDVRKLPTDPGVEKALVESYNALNNAKELAKYFKKLIEDTALQIAKRGKLNSLKDGHVTEEAIEAVLRERMAIRGQAVGELKGIAAADFQATIKNGPFVDSVLSGTDHGSLSHLIQLDFVYEKMMAAAGGDIKKVFSYLATPNGGEVWGGIFDNGASKTANGAITVNRLVKPVTTPHALEHPTQPVTNPVATQTNDSIFTPATMYDPTMGGLIVPNTPTISTPSGMGVPTTYYSPPAGVSADMRTYMYISPYEGLSNPNSAANIYTGPGGSYGGSTESPAGWTEIGKGGNLTFYVPTTTASGPDPNFSPGGGLTCCAFPSIPTTSVPPGGW